MDQAAHALVAANLIYARANSTATNPQTASRPSSFKAIGISLAVGSGLFIGISFVLKKVGLLKANEKYQEVAGEGYGYLKNVYWWSGMTLMIIGEICNFAAYMFVDAILVAPLGALSVVITAILSSIFLKERLSMVGKVGCFLCIIGSVVIAMNGPSQSATSNIQEMQHFVIAPGFLSYTGVVIISCAFIALWAGPRYGKKTMMVYLSICSLIGGLSVVATQGLGAAIITQIQGTPQFNQWFTYVLLVFIIITLVTEIIFLNKALNLYNAALVTPTYYVFFTSATIVSSTILFRGFKGTPTSIITVIMGFFVICAGVVLLQLSKSAKDVPDSAVFAGDLDQMRTIAEQEQPESEPKADAIRGAAAIVRRFSTTRQKMEMDEAKRLHAEKLQDLEPIGENEHVEWDGLRRRRTTLGSRPSLNSRGGTSSPFPAFETVHTPQLHPPLGMSRFPTDSDSEHDEERPSSASFFGSVRTRATSIIRPHGRGHADSAPNIQSPMRPVPLTEISIPAYKGAEAEDAGNPYYGHEALGGDHTFGLPAGLRDQKTEYENATGERGRHIKIIEEERAGSRGSNLHPDAAAGPTPPPHSARRQFSFQNVFRKGQGHSQASPLPQNDGEQAAQSSRRPVSRRGTGGRKGSHGAATKGATEEERLGLVKGDTMTGRHPTLPPYEDDEEDSQPSDWINEDKAGGRGNTSGNRNLTPRAMDKEMEIDPIAESDDEDEELQERRRHKLTKKNRSQSGSGSQSGGRDPDTPPRPPPHDKGTLGKKGGRSGGGASAQGAFI